MGTVAVVLSAQTPVGDTLCRCLAQCGWSVYGGSATPSEGVYGVPMDPRSLESMHVAAKQVGSRTGVVDLLIANASIPTADVDAAAPAGRRDYAALRRSYDAGAAGALRFIEAFLPLTAAGRKRIAFVTSPIGRLDDAIPTGDLGAAMAATAIRRAAKILFNDLRRDGYTFRIFSPADPDAPGVSAAACDCFLGDSTDEDRLTIVDAAGTEQPF